MANHVSGVQWSTAPKDLTGGENLRIVRAPATGKIKGMILSHSVTGTYTHYLNGRTQPCMGQCCDGCEKALPKRWHGWVILLNEDTEEKSIFEMTEGVGERLAEFFSQHRTLRGLRIAASRMGSKSNGRVVLWRGEQVKNHAELPRCPDLQKVLLKIWGLDNEQGLAVVGGAMPPSGTLDGQTYLPGATG